MRIGIDMISAGSGAGPSSGGMSVYYSGLTSALASMPPIESVVAFVAPSADHLELPGNVIRHQCQHLPRHRLGRVLYEQTIFPIAAARTAIDVLLSTCNTRPLLYRRPNVVVLQSLQYLFFPNSFGRLRHAYLSQAVPASARSAQAVIAVSEFERQQAIRLFDLNSDRVFTVYHGLSQWFRAAPDAAAAVAPIDRPYIVMVSSLYGFKNHRRLIEAFAELCRARAVPHRLVLAGGDADCSKLELAELAAARDIRDRVLLLGAVPHDQVPALVAAADVVAYPSLFETFGLPILEALAMGRPLVTSNQGAMAEVAADAARLVDPNDVQSIAAGLEDAIFDESLRSQLRSAGPRRAAQFTWERCAEGTLRALSHATQRD